MFTSSELPKVADTKVRNTTNIQLATGANAKVALEGTLTDLISKIAGDKELHNALLR